MTEESIFRKRVQAHFRTKPCGDSKRLKGEAKGHQGGEFFS